MKEIPLGANAIALVDDSDYENVMQHSWHKAPNKTTYYAKTGSSLYMHTFLTGWKRIDHINGNGFDNRRENLRECTQSQNIQNATAHKDGSSVYKGVYLRSKNSTKWAAHIKTPTKRIHLGSFDSQEEAALAYNKAAMRYFGEFAKLNIIK